jgi:hypothetical protein
VATCLVLWRALPLRSPTSRWRALPFAKMVPFHSTHAVGPKFPSKVVWTIFEIVLEEPNRFKKRIGFGCSRKLGARHQPVSHYRTESRNFTFSVAAISTESPCVIATFIVNSKHQSGARPSVRLCVGLISSTHTRTEGRGPVWGSEFTTKAASQQGNSAEVSAGLKRNLYNLTDCLLLVVSPQSAFRISVENT